MFRTLRSLLAAAVLAAFVMPAQASDETTVLDNLVGMPAQTVQAFRDTFGKVYITVNLYDLHTASNATNPAGGTILSPVAGNITRMQAITMASVATAVSIDASIVLVPFINGTLITGGTITVSNLKSTIQDASAVSNDVETSTPTAARAVSVDDVITIDSNGGGSVDLDAVIVIEIDRDDL